jgi:tryptophan 2,3-dioxygenase
MPQGCQVAGNGGLRNPQHGLQIANTDAAKTKQIQEPQASWIRRSFKYFIQSTRKHEILQTIRLEEYANRRPDFKTSSNLAVNSYLSIR